MLRQVHDEYFHGICTDVWVFHLFNCFMCDVFMIHIIQILDFRSRFQVFIYVQFWCRCVQRCDLFFIFRYLWVSAGPTFSVLLVNANKYSGVICFKCKLLFIWCFNSSFIDSHEMTVLPVLNVLAKCFCSHLCLFGFHIRNDREMHENDWDTFMDKNICLLKLHSLSLSFVTIIVSLKVT